VIPARYVFYFFAGSINRWPYCQRSLALVALLLGINIQSSNANLCACLVVAVEWGRAIYFGTYNYSKTFLENTYGRGRSDMHFIAAVAAGTAPIGCCSSFHAVVV